MSKYLHVLILPSWYSASAKDISGSFFREQAIALFRKGHKVGVLAPIFKSWRKISNITTEKNGFKYENDCGVETYRFFLLNWAPRVSFINRYRFLNKGLNLFDLYIKKNGVPDIIHVHSIFDAGFLAFEIEKKYKIPYVITEHSTGYSRGIYNKNKIDLSKKIVNKSMLNIAVSNQLKLTMESLIYPSKWKYIPNMVDRDFFNSEEISNNSNFFTFINVCFLENKKKVDILIRAFSILSRNNKNIRLKIGGDGPELSNLKKLVHEEGVQDKVFFLGMLSRNQVKKEIESSNAFVLTSEYETFGVVLIEALALGIPVIATRCGGPESIINAEVGLLINKNSVSETVTAMSYLYENINQYKGSDLKDYCKSNFSQEAIVDLLEDVYIKSIKRY